MVFDIAVLLTTAPSTRVLLITDSPFGRTLADLQSNVQHAGFSYRLDHWWRTVFDAPTIEEYFEASGCQREGQAAVENLSPQQDDDRTSIASLSRESWSSRDGSILPELPISWGAHGGTARAEEPPSKSSNPPPPPAAKSVANSRSWPQGLPPSPGKQLGTIHVFMEKRQFGFIAPLEGGPKVFFHQSDVLLPPGVKHSSNILRYEVEYKVGPGRGGKQAAVEITGPAGRPLPCLE